MTKIWLDDIRDAPDDTWTVARTPWGCLNLLMHSDEPIEVLSLDHDLAAFSATGEERHGTWVLNRLEELAHHYPDSVIPKLPREFRIHSANPVGRKNMQAAIWSIGRMRDQYER